MVFSGLNISWLNEVTIYGLISPIRVGWVIVLIYLCKNLTLRDLHITPFSWLVSIWISWHLLNLSLTNGSVPTTLTRVFQAGFIFVLVTSVAGGSFCLRRLSKKAFPWLSFFSWLSLAVLLAAYVTDVQSVRVKILSDYYGVLRSNIIGNASNFSIFCAQFIALYLFRDLYLSQRKTISLSRSLIYLVPALLPFFIWQIFSTGRAGLILSVLTICGYWQIRYGIKGTLISATTVTIAPIAIFFLLYFVMTPFDLPPYSLELAGKGLLKGISKPEFQNVIEMDLALFLIWIDEFSSGRVSILIETFKLLTPFSIFVGFGVDQVRVIDNTYLPHVELVRYLAELGVLGLLIALLIYLCPYGKSARSPTTQFAFLYTVGFLLTSLLQPSGPLIHLSNAIVYWLLFGYLLRQRTKQTICEASDNN